MPAPVDVRAWWGRIHNAERLWMFERPLWERLEDAVDGVYPDISDDDLDDAADGLSDALLAGRCRFGAQLDVNVLGQGFKHYLGIAFDRRPSFQFRDLDTDDEEAVTELVKLVRRLAEAGKAVKAGRDAMASSLTRGVFAMWPLVERSTVGVKELMGRSIPPAAIVEAAMRGEWDGKIPVGVDCAGVITAANQILGEPRIAMSLQEKPIADLTALIDLAQKRCAAEIKRPHAAGLAAKLTWVALPYGDWFLADSTVTDFDKAGWCQRKVVLTVDEFQNDPTFTDEAKKAVRPFASQAPDKGVPITTSSMMGGSVVGGVGGSTTQSAQRAVEEEGRIVLREVWDKVNWRRFFLADTYDGVVSKDDAPLYMGDDGRPLFPDFFPCTFRTPIQRARLCAARLLGKPLLEDAWSAQIGYIESLSAYARAARNTIRVSVAGAHVDGETLTEWKEAKDSTCIRLSKDAPVDTDPSKQFIALPTPPVPFDLLKSADVFLSMCCSLMRINRGVVTGDPVANTATQEQISVSGSSLAQSDIVKVWEDGFGETVFKGLLIFLHSASPQEFEAYMGAKALAPRPQRPKIGSTDPATGQPTLLPQPDLPSIVDSIKGMNLMGAHLECKFDSSTRDEQSMRKKQFLDAIGTANLVRDKTGTPYVDLGDLIDQYFREAEIPTKPWKPSDAEEEMEAQAAMGGGAPDNDGDDPAAKHSDSRKAGGGRGAPTSPGRQSRHQDPGGNGHPLKGRPENSGSQNGHQIRRATATS